MKLKRLKLVYKNNSKEIKSVKLLNSLANAIT